MIESVVAMRSFSACVPSRHGAIVISEHSELQVAMAWPPVRRRRWTERRVARPFAGVWHWASTGRPVPPGVFFDALEPIK